MVSFSRLTVKIPDRKNYKLSSILLEKSTLSPKTTGKSRKAKFHLSGPLHQDT
jgi:hypothetical protein